ncbi:MSMEG_0570 family nitrogen starvation response protein [Pseudotabrizicola alkalilacus]|uniref:MSMEG_0570 family nitrogen starvation response protein n=1 Tax=Pseudotabrizicola alkalilacus TaxID=2305252 RepID=A0A411Z4Q5_9RHOB|nr:MSMEG_0570 family nitrogen starvation response protein [Pseudotabrizicola alkalilacus]RGP38035.1 MSMEG_0570 family nitrogen starvation response protein [Pseudotabrizicola alkalilacus]
MPEVIFHIRWPDGVEEQYYSPSTIIRQHLIAGESYPLDEFVARARAGLIEASDRVALKYGFACSSAMDQLARIEATARRYHQDDAPVTCLSLQ